MRNELLRRANVLRETFREEHGLSLNVSIEQQISDWRWMLKHA